MSRRNPTDPTRLDADVVELSEREGEEGGLVTDIASFFEADYVSPRRSDADLGRRAQERAQTRRTAPTLLLRR